jgi:hypothetical protein
VQLRWKPLSDEELIKEYDLVCTGDCDLSLWEKLRSQVPLSSAFSPGTLFLPVSFHS